MAASKIPKRFMPTTLDDSNIAAGANIASSKLADGANFLKKDGTVAWTGANDAGNFKLVNLATPTNPNDASNKSYVDNQIAALNSIFDSKSSAKAATTANILISNPGTAIFDGITLSNGDVLYVRAQSAPAENGLYVFNGSAAALTRHTSMDAWNEIPGAFFAVEQGSTYADTLWLCTSDQGGTLGTTAITFFQIPLAGLTSSNFITFETPSGTVDGSNVTFTLANTPVAGTVELYIEGYHLVPGSGNDYTISGATLTLLTAPLSGERLFANYRK